MRGRAPAGPPTERSTGRSHTTRRTPRFQCPAHGADRLKSSGAVDKYSSTSGFAADTAPSDAGYAAVLYAQGQVGLPYLWGGDGPAEGGWDCSGLTRAAYRAAGRDLPRTAQTQYEAGPVVPPGEPLQIGDLVYYGTATNIHHVAIYIGNGQMISAPGQGKVVHVAPYRWAGDDYFGATRPGK
ncbi:MULTISPECIES: C40 family peptidase [Pseudofrankia]